MPYSRLFYHFIWTTKHRLPLMTDLSQRERIFRAIAAKVVDLHGIARAVGGISDHVHLVATVPPNMALSIFIGQVKGASSHMASRLIAGHIEPFQWQDDYGVLSVSESHLPFVVNYVLNQVQHHQAILSAASN